MKKLITIIMLSSLLTACKTVEKNRNMTDKKETVAAPSPRILPYAHKIHKDVRMDNYYWMKLTDEQKNADNPDPRTKEVVAYLEEENEYTAHKLKHLDNLRSTLYDEIVGRIKQTDNSVPYFMNGYFYSTKFQEGQEYPVYSRTKDTLSNEEQVMLDVNVLAGDKDYYSARGLSVSPDNKLLAYGEDTLSRRIYSIRFKNLETGELLVDVIPNTTGSLVWANDNKTVFYTVKDATLRAYKIYKHVLGTAIDQDVEIFHETDETFRTYVTKSKSKKYIIIGSQATVSSEFRYVSADDPNQAFKIFEKRKRDHEYSISHFEDKWYIVTNLNGAKNFKVMTTSEDATESSNWKDFLPHREDVLVTDLAIFKDYLVVDERIDGIAKVKVIPWADQTSSHYIDFGEEAYMSYSSVNREYDTEVVRVFFSSLTTPGTTYDYNMKERKLKLMKRQEVVGDFDPADYSSERINVKVRDGVKVPVSLVYKKGFKKDGSQPILLYAYGSYGSSMDPYFNSVRLSLLDRGFGFAIAHVRGGQELGRKWYEDGKLLKKKNTFYDFIDVGKYLVDSTYTSTENLFCMGGSAGGLLIGAVVNMEPQLWKGAIAAVPFVDVITTMLDETIPLTTGEYDEWGNPNQKEYYNYIKTYSPYDNVRAMDYPAMLVTTGFHDSQVQYWEPAKWVAKLRELKTDNNLLLLHTEMGAGHGGKSGRFQRYHETALEYAFLLDLANRVKIAN